MEVRIEPRANRSASTLPFEVGAIIEDHCGHRFGVLRIEQEDAEMSRYTLVSCLNGSPYSNMPHYTMKLVKPANPDSVRLAEKTMAAWSDEIG